MAQQARAKALKQLAAKPPIDEAVVAQRKGAQEAKVAAETEKRAATKAAIEQAKADKIAAAEAAAEAAKIHLSTAAELKAARDARYAARKEALESRGLGAGLELKPLRRPHGPLSPQTARRLWEELWSSREDSGGKR